MKRCTEALHSGVHLSSKSAEAFARNVKELFPSGVVLVVANEDALLAKLHPDEELYLRNFRSKKRKEEYWAGRVCARQALNQLGDFSAALLKDAGGAPVWPPGIVGSITHCYGYCAAAAARSSCVAALGFDAEVSKDVGYEVASILCTEKELSNIGCLPNHIRSLALAASFSAKESIYKATYPLIKMVFEFRDVELEMDFVHWEFRICSTRVRPDILKRLKGFITFSNTHVLSTAFIEAPYATSF